MAPPPKNAAQVRSITFNIKGLQADGVEEIARLIVEKNPDVVFFHEVDTDKQRKGLQQIDLIRRRVDAQTREARGSCPASDVVFGAEVGTTAHAIMTRNGFTISAGEEVETVPDRAKSNGRLRLSEVPPALVAMVKAPFGKVFSVVSTTDHSAAPVLTRLAKEQSRSMLSPRAVLVDDLRGGAVDGVLAELTLS